MDKLSECRFFVPDPDNAFAFARSIFRIGFAGFWHGNSEKILSFNLMGVWLCIIDINKVDDQLGTAITIYWSSYICFGQFNKLQASDRQRSGDIIPHAVNYIFHSWRWAKNCPKHVELIWRSINSGLRPTTIWGHYTTCCKSHLSLLRMGKELPETRWANMKINKLQVSDRQRSGDIIPHAVNYIFRSWGWAKNYPKHIELIWRSINCYCCI